MNKRYPSYKPSGIEWIGEVPEHWTIKRLKYVATSMPSSVDKKSKDGEQSVRLCNYTDVYKNEFITDDINFMDATASVEQIEKFSLNQGDVLATKDSEDPKDIAIPAVVSQTLPGVVCGYHLTHIKPDPAYLNGFYLFRLFQSYTFNQQFTTKANGITRYGLPALAFSDAYICLPPLTEQDRIASYLHEKTAFINQTIQKKQRLIELLQEERTAFINRAVTRGLNPDVKLKPSSVEWLGNIPELWTVKPIKHLKAKIPNAFVDGPFGSNLKSLHFVEDGDVYVIESGFITSGQFVTRKFKTIEYDHFLTIKRSECKEGDIIIAKIGANYGMSGILPRLDKPSVVSGNSLKLTVNAEVVDKRFVHFFLLALKSSGELKKIVSSTAQPALSLGELNDVKLAVPPLNVQQAILKELDEKLVKLDDTKSSIETEIRFLIEYRTALISEVVTGKICVVDNPLQESKETVSFTTTSLAKRAELV